MNRIVHHGARRRVALLGVVAILLQAILFGWHHHAVALASHGAQSDVHANGVVPFSPATAADDCDICQTLHHLTGAPGEFAVLLLPAAVVVVGHRSAIVLVDRAAQQGFRARAPPRA
jgi:hypothetical protein